MKLIEMVKKKGKTMVAPLIGYPGVQLTDTTVLENLKDAKKQFETIHTIIKEYKPDIVLPFMDLSVEAEALGLKVEFHEDESPDVKEHPLKNVNQLNNYKIPAPKHDGRLNIFVEVIKKLKQNTGTLVGGYAASPFTLAGLMMGAENLAMNTIMEPEFSHSTIDFATRTIIPYAKAQQEAGADFIVLLEPTAVLLSPALFDEFVSPYVDQMVDALSVPVVLHVCGQTTNLVRNMCRTKVQGLSLDSMVNFPEISRIVPEDVVLIGNISPVEVMLNMNAENVYKITLEFLESMKDVPNFILSTGCDLPPATPHKNIAAFCKAAESFNSRKN